MSLERARDLVAEHGIDTVECVFPDVWGIPRGKRLPAGNFLKTAAKGYAIASVSLVWDMHCFIFGTPFCPYDSGWPDMMAVPDLSTLRPVTWREGTALCVCDTIDEATHEPVAVSPRHILRRAVERVRAHGYEPLVGSEIEFHLCTPDWEPLYTGVHCYSIAKGSELEPVLRDIRVELEAFGIVVEASNAEYGPGQAEVNLAYGAPLEVADSTMIFKYVVKEIARRHGLRATFMPKPYPLEAGNGLHIHQSLRELESGTNAFAATDLGEGPIRSSLMRRYLAGLLAHQVELTAINCPTINSYKRVEDYSFSPTCVTWGGDNRTVAVRTIAARGEASRLESRGASADSNPYLVVAGALFAGEDGLARELPLPEWTPGDAYVDETSPRIPLTLAEALRELERSSFCRDRFGDLFVDTFLAMGRHEVDTFNRQVTDWEKTRYREVM